VKNFYGQAYRLRSKVTQKYLRNSVLLPYRKLGRQNGAKFGQAKRGENRAEFSLQSRLFHDRETIFGQHRRMPDEHYLALRQADQARTDFAIIETELEALHARLARMPTRADLARAALGIMFCTAVLVIAWFEVFWRHCL
jgi:hypothetical protein